ncbi:hypothetical protein BDP81DRAFT_215839 [Colletotrichum phormii]|uniref:Uncharacterized protein n=1 Tax=Colletotrichum phormii TaxID=359342 RepID=A0AAI9ZVX8_9PEZI|nr:uncharacterized protein BDP81DRAFT_215839 [Colletotrichum phormii]KAK1637968.1 hypothetical protein BDP81DRAFT_215839 [Colletotrichum phormii]
MQSTEYVHIAAAVCPAKCKPTAVMPFSVLNQRARYSLPRRLNTYRQPRTQAAIRSWHSRINCTSCQRMYHAANLCTSSFTVRHPQTFWSVS